MTEFVAEDELVPFMMDPQMLEDGPTHTESPYSSGAYKRSTAGIAFVIFVSPIACFTESYAVV